MPDAQILLLIIPILLFSIIIHEIAHGYAALLLGDPTAKRAGRLTLNPLVHMDPFGSVLLPLLTSLGGFFFGYAKPVPYNPANLTKAPKWGDAIVAVAGPASNLGLAVIFAVVLRVYEVIGGGNSLVISGFFYIVLINIFLMLLNLIPIAPLDGSKILYSMLPYNKKHIFHWMERHQMWLMITLLIVLINTSFLSGITMVIAGLLVG